MKTLSKSRITGAVGALVAFAGALLLAAIVVPADPLGRVVGALIGASFAIGLLGTLAREALRRREYSIRAPRAFALERYAPTPAIVATPRVADATASEFDGDRRPAFAPVISLTEAQVERRRQERSQERRHETLTRA